jgi:hypothetical protein
VLQEDGCSSIYKSWLCVLTCIISVCSLSMPYNCLLPGNLFTLLTTVYFSQVKNKPWLPWVFNWISYRREQLWWRKKTIFFHDFKIFHGFLIATLY